MFWSSLIIHILAYGIKISGSIWSVKIEPNSGEVVETLFFSKESAYTLNIIFLLENCVDTWKRMWSQRPNIYFC